MKGINRDYNGQTYPVEHFCPSVDNISNIETVQQNTKKADILQRFGLTTMLKLYVLYQNVSSRKTFIKLY